ncbi:MAG: twinkle protein [Alphaproteobacteria bacterium]|nr:twinkle protein [Alphaproteobacteria bacterium]
MAEWLINAGFYQAAAPVHQNGECMAGAQLSGWLERLPRVDKYILVGEARDDWRRAQHDLAAQIGAARCWFIEWPTGKFAAPKLFEGTAFEKYLSHAKPWPVDGLYTLDEMPEAPQLELWGTGFEEIGQRIRLAPTMLSVVTGYPGHGKSHVWSQIWHQIAREQEIRAAMFAAETRVKPHLRRVFRECYHGDLQRRMTPSMLAEADDFTRAHFMFLNHPSEKPSMTWLMDMIEVAAIRHGCRAVIIDPWNKVEADYDPRAMTETAWIGWCLDRFIEMARALNIHIQIIAHPAKPEAQSRKNPPDLYSISGSAHWNNRVDQGFVVYREKMMDGANRATAAQLICTKARFQELGYPSKHDLNFDLDRGVFESVIDPQKPVPAASRGDDGWGAQKQEGLF